MTPGSHKTIQCAECHRVPTSTNAVGHNDSALPAELTLGPLAAGTNWNGSTCTNSYGHGSTLQGGTITNPLWTALDNSAAACGACHGAPPPAPHPAGSQCQDCHGDVVGPGMVITNPALHVDGTLQADAVHPPGWSEPAQHGYSFNQ